MRHTARIELANNDELVFRMKKPRPEGNKYKKKFEFVANLC